MTSGRWASGWILVAVLAVTGCVQDGAFETGGAPLAMDDYPYCDVDADGDIDNLDRDAGEFSEACYNADVIQCWDLSDQCAENGGGCDEWQALCGSAGWQGDPGNGEGGGGVVGGGCVDLTAQFGEAGVFYSQNPGCDANGNGTIDLDDVANGAPDGCDRDAINQCIEAAENCAAGETLDDSPWYSCAAQAWMCSAPANCGDAGGGGGEGGGGEGGGGNGGGVVNPGPIDPIANQNVLIGGASQAEQGGLETLPNIDYVWWWDHVSWRAGVDEVLAHPGVVSTVAFWFCANLYRTDYVNSMGGPASGVLVPGEDWGTYTRSLEEGVDLLLANGYNVVMMTTNTTTVAAGFPEPISWSTQQNIYTYNDYIRWLAADRMASHPGRVALVDVAAVTSTDTNGALRAEYAQADQYHMTAPAYSDAIRPALSAGLASVGVQADWTGTVVENADARLRWW